MSKVVLNDVAAGYTVSVINSNFQKIEDALNDKVLFRDNPEGEPNQLESDLDLNGKNLYNGGSLRVSEIELNGVTLEPDNVVVNATVHPFEFTATSGQTDFDVSPFVPTSSAVLVSINGEDIPPSEVDINNSIITLSPRTLGDKVVIRVFTRDVGAAPSADDILFINKGTGAQTRTVQERLRDAIHVRDYGAVGDGVVDDTAAIQNAINAATNLTEGCRTVVIDAAPGGFYKITSPLTVPVNFLTIYFNTNASILKKFFNGEVFHINGGEVEIHRCAIDGNGATYTGGGIRLLSNAANAFRLVNPRIKETAAAPLLIEADAGSLMKVQGGLLQPYNASPTGPTHAVAMLGADTGPKNRLFLGFSSGGAPLVDASGAETMLIHSCDGSGITTSATSKKVSAVGNRMQTAGANVMIFGVDHCYVANTVASRLELAAGAFNCTVKDNVQVGGDSLDVSGNTSNKVEGFGNNYTPNWTASSINPTLGDGVLSGTWDRRDKEIFVTVSLTIGSSTTLGTGSYSFGIPLQAVAGRNFVGSAWLNDAGTNFLVGTVLVDAGAISAQVYFNGASNAMGPTIPITLATGDRLRFQIRYIAA